MGGGGATSNLNSAGNGFTQFTNFTLLSNNTDMFYSGSNNNAAPTPRWFNSNSSSTTAAGGAPAQDNLFFNNPSSGGGFDREGLDAIASADGATRQNGGEAGVDMTGVNWPSAISSGAGGNSAGPWNSLMFGGAASGHSGAAIGDEAYQPAGGSGVFGQQTQTHAQTQNREQQADETLRMLLRFLDG